MKNNILILDAQAVQTLIISEYLCRNNYYVHLFCNDKINYGYHTKYAKHKNVAPSISKEIEYKEFLINYINNNNIAGLIPMTDESALFLSKHKLDLLKYTKFIMPDLDVFKNGYDKNLLMTLCSEKGYPHPITIDLSKQDINEIKDEDISFPAIIKPNYTSGGRGMTLVNNLEELKRLYPSIYQSYGDCHLQQFIKAGGKQIKVQVFIHRETNKYYSTIIHKQRFYPENGGSSCCNITIENEDLVKLCVKILDDIGWDGFADFDLIEDPNDGIMKIMEINPRIPACIKSAILSGVDYGTLIVDATLQKQLKEYKYVPGQKLRHIGFELLWFYYSKNRFRVKPSWFNFFDKNLSFQDFNWRDPLPFIYGTYGNIKKQISSDFNKQKSGLR